MKTVYRVYLASKSPSRQRLLKESGIPFEVIDQTADEDTVSLDQSLQSLVTEIATLKMQHAVLPVMPDGAVAFVLTADTMGIDHTGTIQGKPKSFEDAAAKIRSYRHGAITGTALCLERRRRENGAWIVEDARQAFASAVYTFDMPDEWIEDYVRNSFIYHGIDCMQVSGAVAIEGFGAQFIKKYQK